MAGHPGLEPFDRDHMMTPLLEKGGDATLPQRRAADESHGGHEFTVLMPVPGDWQSAAKARQRPPRSRH